ncbi:histidine phosphatase family protein [Catellatospora sp. KI3]|uniref:histidine phosphatase family protein n=1 Tax=Catellatospora sp. KI3 TaxID=3041620 RepID=UPI002482A1E1|nr:histidine phosphatase family protein [Catellatospora sp. KI3]MDI1465377.1 histidine phosphatase family protein [Catellatospora sp. KI3]
MGELEWLGVIRHGESIGNLAALRAERDGAERLDLAPRDPDVPLSPLGLEQASAVNRWLRAVPPPDLVLVSPYLRTVETARAALAGAPWPTSRDERLRDRDLGQLDLLTTHGVRTLYPQEAERRQRLGKFYYRPPGGESWADVALRLRSLLADLRRDHDGGRVLLFTHDVVVQLVRYLVEDLSEEQLMDSARRQVIANASVGTWARDAAGRLVAGVFNDITHLRAEDTRPTAEEGVRAEPV